MAETILGKYRILAEIGRGGFATVYRALDTTLDREVALKVLGPQYSGDPAAIARFRRETAVAGRLRHPHVVAVHECGEAEGRLYIAMDLVAGPTLRETISASGGLAWDQAIEILGHVADALDYAHTEGVIHRDLKPSNILLDPAGGALLTDFGLAHVADDLSISSSSPGILGTLAYIAPEVWAGKEATQATDLYALGCIAFEMLTGKALFGDKTLPGIMKQHEEGPQFRGQWPEGVPAGVTAVLRKAMARQPADRYADALEFVDALKTLHPRQKPGRVKMLGYIAIIATLAALGYLAYRISCVQLGLCPVLPPVTPQSTTPPATSAPASAPTRAATPLPTARTRAPTVRPTSVAQSTRLPPAACPNPDALITEPQNGAVVSGVFSIDGTAKHEKFLYYKLEWGVGSEPTEWSFYSQNDQPVENGKLGTFDASRLAAGIYAIRLVVVETSGNYPAPCAVVVKVQSAGAPNNASNATPTSYVVQKGDTLYAIAQRFNVTVAALQAANNISDPRLLRAGQVLMIPGN